MTTELQRAMARYEEARAQYKKAVLASFDGASNGDGIRKAIQTFRRASADLKRLTAPVAPAPPAAPAPAEAEAQPREPEAFPVWSFMRRLLRGREGILGPSQAP